MLERNLDAAKFLMKEVAERLENNRKLISVCDYKGGYSLDVKALETIDLPDISKIYREINNIVKRITSLKVSVDKNKTQKTLKILKHRGSFKNLNTDSSFRYFNKRVEQVG